MTAHMPAARTGFALPSYGEPVTDAPAETWQADPDGRFDINLQGDTETVFFDV
ncbi:MAG TPA: hypothetical protein VMV17_00085 [Streptosporangiaceae bacterium]|nr:hypothetical protein [Streptosporangiaceae bacterium]